MAAASWRDRLQPAKFREAEFFVESAEGEVGRKTVLHSYPQRDVPFAEDMGRKERGFTLEAYVIGRDYMAARDRLIEALESPGPGTLVHPYRGTVQVVLVSARGPVESVREGGMARFSLVFSEAGENTYPSPTFNTAALVDAKADAAITAVGDDFASEFNVAGMAEFVSTHAQGLVADGLTALRDISSMLSEMPSGLTSFVGDLDRVSGMVASLIRQPSSLASEMLGLVRGLGNLFARPENALRAYRSLWPFGNQTAALLGTTPSRSAMATNEQAFFGLIRQASAIEAARSASQITFADALDAGAASRANGVTIPYSEYDNLQAATELRDDLAAQLDTAMETAPDATYAALADLRAAVVRDINTRGADLSTRSYYTPAATQPALLLAYQLYGDAMLDSLLLGRNDIRHPGFIPAGQAIEVLNG